MIVAHDIARPLSRAHQQALARAVDVLENPNFAARLADYAGAPVNRIVQMLPRPAGRGLSFQSGRGGHGEVPEDGDRLA